MCDEDDENDECCDIDVQKLMPVLEKVKLAVILKPKIIINLTCI